MIHIHELSINPQATEIQVVVSTPDTAITSILLWNKDTYKKTEEATDLTSMLLETTTVTDPDTKQISFTVTAQKLNVTRIIGPWFFEFKIADTTPTAECIEEATVATGLVANLVPYHECILNRVMKAKVEHCNLVHSKNCDPNNLFFLNTLLSTLTDTLQLGLYLEAVKILDYLDECCEVCHTCPDYGDTYLTYGLGFGTKNNDVALL